VKREDVYYDFLLTLSRFYEKSDYDDDTLEKAGRTWYDGDRLTIHSMFSPLHDKLLEGIRNRKSWLR